MSQELRIALFAGVIPGLLAGMPMLAIWWLGARRARRARSRAAESADNSNTTDVRTIASVRDRLLTSPFWIAPLAIALAWISAPRAIDSVFYLWPDDNTKRLSHAIVLVALLGLIEGLVRVPIWVAAILRAVFFAGAWWMLTEGYHPQAVPTPDYVGWIIAVAIGGSLIATLADAGFVRTRAWVGGVVITIWGGALAPMLFLAGYAIGAQTVIAAVAFGVAAAIVGLIVRRTTLARGTATALTGVLLAMLAGAGVQSEPLSAPGLVLLGLTPIAFGAFLLAGNDRSVRALVAGLTTLALTGGGAAFTLKLADDQRQVEQGSDDPYGDYYE